MPYLGDDEIGELGSTATPRREPPSATARTDRGLPSRPSRGTATRSSWLEEVSRRAPATHTPTPLQTYWNWLDDDPERGPSAQSDETAAPREPPLRIRALSTTHTVGPRTTTQLEQDSAGNPSHTGPTLEQMMQQARTLRARYPEAPLNRHEAAAVHDGLRRWLDAHSATRAEELPVRRALSGMSESDAAPESPPGHFSQVVASVEELQPELEVLEAPRVEQESLRQIPSRMLESDAERESRFYSDHQAARSVEELQRRLDALEAPSAAEDPPRQALSRLSESGDGRESRFYRHHQAARSMEALQRRLDALRGPHAEASDSEVGDPNQQSRASSP